MSLYLLYTKLIMYSYLLHEKILNGYIKEGKLNSLILYMSKNDITVSLQISFIGTLMHIAALFNQVDIMEELINRGAKVDVQNCFGWTPLMMAAKHKANEAVELLVNNNADIYLKNFLGVDALFLACASGDVKIVHLLLCEGALLGTKNGALISPIMMASFNGHFEIVTKLSKVCCVNQYNSKLGMTSLMCASIQNHERIVVSLVLKEAKLNMKNKAGVSAFGICLWFQHQDLCDFLRFHVQKTKIGCYFRKWSQSFSNISRAWILYCINAVG